MNSYERVTRRLRGEPVDRPPNFNIMMSFAAHHVGRPLRQYYLDFRVLCEANLAVHRDFGLDIMNTMSDAYRETADWGAAIEFPDDGLPKSKVPLLRELADIRTLQPPNPATGRRMSDRVSAVRYYREQVGGEVPIMGWVEGALAETADLRGVSTLMTDLVDSPEQVEEVLERCTENAIEFARIQIDAGADIIGLGDAVASQISPRMYQRFGLPYEQRIFGAVRAMGALTRLHICGNISKILPHVAKSGADIVDVDWMVDFAAAREICSGASVCGNFDPVAIMLQSTPDTVRQAVTHALDLGGPRGFSMAGCEIPEGTPHANLLAHAQALQEYGAAAARGQS
jgi:MtaA/CmuA family methyltransferase